MGRGKHSQGNDAKSSDEALGALITGTSLQVADSPAF